MSFPISITARLLIAMIAFVPFCLISEGTAQAKNGKKYSGPLGLPWGINPEEAKILLTKRLTFVREWDGPGNEVYVTTEQLYSGLFGGLPTEQIQLKYYNRGFFYLSVVLTPLAKASRIFEEVVAKMEEAYGPPDKISKPEKLFSPTVNIADYPIDSAHKDRIVNMFLQADGGKGPARYELLDTLIKMGHWDPTATWRFANKVTVQTFVLPTLADDGQIVLANHWIFSKDDKRESWFESRMRPPVIRDY